MPPALNCVLKSRAALLPYSSTNAGYFKEEPKTLDHLDFSDQIKTIIYIYIYIYNIYIFALGPLGIMDSLIQGKSAAERFQGHRSSLHASQGSGSVTQKSGKVATVMAFTS